MSKRQNRNSARKSVSAGRRKKVAPKRGLRRLGCVVSVVVFLVVALISAAGTIFLHHSHKWIDLRLATWPAFVTKPLLVLGSPVSDFLDGMGITGHDVVYEYDEAAPAGSIIFAGTPRRVSWPAPADIQVLERSEFLIGWSPSLRHPVWVAYHVPQQEKFPLAQRPDFTKDQSAKNCPDPNAYSHSGYDRGHMAPNYAIHSRFGAQVRNLTFAMSNISPQSPRLNRGVWRNVERRIADYWTERYGEIWVIVGAIPSKTGENIGSTGIDIPSAFWQVVVAQEGLDVRALALLYPQDVPDLYYPSRGLVSIDELESLTGLDFLSDLPEFIQAPLEAELPTRLWPVGFVNALRQLFTM